MRLASDIQAAEVQAFAPKLGTNGLLVWLTKQVKPRTRPHIHPSATQPYSFTDNPSWNTDTPKPSSP